MTKPSFYRRLAAGAPAQNPLFLGLLFLLTLIPLLYGFSRFPRFYGDEGVYISQAWWLVKFGHLGPYTYWYDHFPLGWALLGFWQLVTGGPFTFGSSLISGRLLMVLLAGASNLFLFKLIYRITRGSLLLALFGAILFALTPLSVLFHRLTLLDNIATFWLLWSLYLFYRNPQSGRNIFLGSLGLGLAILTKETLIFFLPVFLGAVLWLNRPKNRGYFLVISLMTSGFLISLWPLLAWLKGEFFPGPGHVAFLETVLSQVGRGAGLPFWDPQADFLRRLLVWLAVDPFLVLLSGGSLLLMFFLRRQDKAQRTFHFYTLAYLLFLLRGGLVFDFYIIPLLPFLVIEICLLLSYLKQEEIFPRGWANNGVFWLIAILGVSLGLIWEGRILYLVDATANQLQAIKSLEAVDPGATIVVDDYAFLDLRLNRQGQPRFTNVEWYARAELDPAVRVEKLNDDSGRIDYLLVNKVMAADMTYGNFSFLSQSRDQLVPTNVFEAEIPKELGKLKSIIAHFSDEVILYARKGEVDSTGGQIAVKPEEKATQVSRLVWFVPSGQQLSDGEIETIREGRAGGLMLLAKNIESYDQVKALISQIQQVSTGKMKIAVDQEGGSVSRLPWLESTAQGQITAEAEALMIARARGQELKDLGIAVNFSPVLDITRDQNSYIGRTNRSFLDNHGKLGAAMIKGYLEAGVMPVAKHFPGGLGRVEVDPHQALPQLSLSQDQLEQDLQPFREAIVANVPAIMVTHILYPEIDQNPSSKSSVFLTDILRGRLAFPGLIITDDLSMAAVTTEFAVGDYAVASLRAGADMFLVSEANDVVKVRTALETAVATGELSQERIKQSLQRLEQAGF